MPVIELEELPISAVQPLPLGGPHELPGAVQNHDPVENQLPEPPSQIAVWATEGTGSTDAETSTRKIARCTERKPPLIVEAGRA